MKIDQQANGNVQQPRVTEELRFTRWVKVLNGLELDAQAIVNQDIEAQRFIEKQTLVVDANNFLRCRTNRLPFEFTQQAPFINRFN